MSLLINFINNITSRFITIDNSNLMLMTLCAFLISFSGSYESFESRRRNILVIERESSFL